MIKTLHCPNENALSKWKCTARLWFLFKKYTTIGTFQESFLLLFLLLVKDFFLYVKSQKAVFENSEYK